MQADGAVRGASTTPPRRGQPNVLLAIVTVAVIAAVAALLVLWSAPFAGSGVGADDADPSAGSGFAIIHDDAWNMPDNAYSAVDYGDWSNLHAST